MHINLSYLIDWLTRHGPHNHMYQFVASRCVSSTWSKWRKVVNIDKQEKKLYFDEHLVLVLFSSQISSHCFFYLDLQILVLWGFHRFRALVSLQYKEHS